MSLRCPECGSDRVEAGEDLRNRYTIARCRDCGHQWREQ